MGKNYACFKVTPEILTKLLGQRDYTLFRLVPSVEEQSLPGVPIFDLKDGYYRDLIVLDPIVARFLKNFPGGTTNGQME
jgi:hypothetical protein